MKCSFIVGLVVMFFMSNIKADENIVVIEDGGIKISKLELTNAIKYWPQNERLLSNTDLGLRKDMLNSFIKNYNIALENDKMTADSDPVFYWKSQFAVRNLKNRLYLDHYISKLKIPDMTELAKEVLIVNRDKFATMPESRNVSHILIKCMKSDNCKTKEKKKEAVKILEILTNGDAKFEDLVDKFSEDPGSKRRKGKINTTLKIGEKTLDPYFVSGAFTIDKVGGYSEVVSTRFGFHIIRLDELTPSSYKSDVEVIPEIIQKLEKRYKLLERKRYTKSLGLSDKAKINNSILDEILSEYADVGESKD